MTSAKHTIHHGTKAVMFIGRVGALAVALGVGGAIAATPGVAWADETSSATSDSTASAPDSTSSAKKTAGSQVTEPGVSADAGAHDDVGSTSGESKPEDEKPSGAVDEISDATDDTPTEAEDGVKTGSGDSTGKKETKRRVSQRTPETRHAVSVDTTAETSKVQANPGSADGAATTGDVGDAEAKVTSSTDVATLDLPGSPSETVATTFATAATEQTVVPHTRTMSLPSVIISAASNLIDTAMESILSSNPNAPTDSPLLWGVLGWVRRQFSAALGDDTPTVGLAQTSLVTAQAVDAQAELPEDLERIVLASGINQPTDLRFLPDGGILIVEKGGAIKVFQNGQIQDQPLLTVTTRTEGERGLTTIEVDPDFRTNHYVYIAYTGADDHERLSRLTVTGYTGDPTTEVLSIDPDSEHILLASDQMAANFHQGGGLLFGPDKMLYWSLGDNFFAPNSQNLATLQGKILRLDPYHLDANGFATAPVGNPFINTAGANPLIYAYGFRNPFRFTFAPDGTLLEADVGGAAWEEVNVVKAGANYGWPLAEGVCDNCGFVNPIYAYPHSPLPELAGSITGITFYTGDALGDAYKNKVFIADYSLGFIRELTFDDKFTSLISERTIDEHAGTPVLLMQGPDGFIYQMNYAEGELLVIRPSGGNKAPTAVVTATPNFGKPAPLSIDFSSQGSTDPEGATLSYSWEFGDNTTSTDQNPTHIYSSNGIYVAMLTVSDGEKTATASQQIFVGNTAPVVEITTPVDESKYNAGTTITFSGSATDGEDATLPDSAFTWTVIFHHSEHIHPFADNLVGRSGSIEIPTDPSQLSNTWYEIKLTVTDSQGLSSTKSVEIRPNLVSLAYGANNPDVIYTIDGIPHKGDYSELGVVGVQHVIGAVSPQTVGDTQMAFSRWSDGGAQQHTVTTPTTDASYSVSFDTLIPHAEFVPGAILKALQQNISSTVAMLGNAFKASTSAVVDAAAGLPATLLGAVRNAVQHPTHLPSIVAGLVTDLVGDVNGVVSPLVSAATDVIVTTAKRAVGTGFALVNNVVPIARALVDAPGEVGSAIKDSADLLFGFLRKLDILGIVGSLQYAQLTIGNEFSHQIDNIVGSVADLQSDILDALSAD